MSQTIQVDPSQVPALIQQHTAQLAAIEEVLSQKETSLSKINEGISEISSGNFAGAFSLFLSVQASEFDLVVRSLTQQRSQVTDILRQLKDPSMIVTPQASPTQDNFNQRRTPFKVPRPL